MKRKTTSPMVDLFAEQRLHENISRFPLVELRLKDLIPWEIFRDELCKVRTDYSRGGRPPYDEVFMFKCLVLQTLYNLSDEALEIEIYNRNSFRVFLGMNIASDVPDRNTIWEFRERLVSQNLEKPLFDKFNKFLADQGLLLKNGTIVDATFVEAPKQRNTPEENRAIKNGKKQDEVFKKRTSRSRSHKDTEARWARKGQECYFGYKNHVSATEDNKFILDYCVTSANVYDGNVLLKILSEQAEESGDIVYADSTYGSAENLAELCKRGFQPEICEKGARHKKLTKSQQENNHRKAKIRRR